LGYTQKDSGGFRQRKDGQGRLTLEYYCISPSFADWAAMGEMIKDQWVAIGLDVKINALGPDLAVQVTDPQIWGYSMGSSDPFLDSGLVFPSNNLYLIGNKYANWFNNGPGPDAEEPFPELKEIMELWRRGYGASEEDRIATGKEIWTKASDIVLQIGVVGGGFTIYGFHLASNKLANIPQRVIGAQYLGYPRQGAPQTYYFTS
jgi:ABC-type transport system substrate-binding protein